MRVGKIGFASLLNVVVFEEGHVEPGCGGGVDRLLAERTPSRVPPRTFVAFAAFLPFHRHRRRPSVEEQASFLLGLGRSSGSRGGSHDGELT